MDRDEELLLDRIMDVVHNMSKYQQAISLGWLMAVYADAEKKEGV